MHRKLDMLDENFMKFMKERGGFAIRDGHAFVEASISSSDDEKEIEVYVWRSKQQAEAPTRLTIYLPNKTNSAPSSRP
jgi:hypothetical protein